MKLIAKTIRFVGMLALAAILSTSMLLAACSGEGNDQPTDTQDKRVTLPIVEAGQSESSYKIVYPVDAIREARKVYGTLRTLIAEKTDCDVHLAKDSDEPVEREILVGPTNRAASIAAYAALGDNQFSFGYDGSSIVIAASDTKCMELAIETFIEKYTTADKQVIYFDTPTTYQCADEYGEKVIDNTKGVGGDDPYVIRRDGQYYYCWSSNGVAVAKIDGLDNIVKNRGTNVFDATKNGFQSVWAPELHYIDGEWYIYVAMCKGTGDNASHRMYCLKGTSQDPTAPFELVGQVTDKTNMWAIDGTVFKYKDELYTVWSGWPSRTDGQQNLYIAHMSNPWTIDSERVLISTPSSWDNITRNPSVNEGPYPLVVGDTVHILYSGNGSWTDDYCIGYLTCKDGDLLNAKSWVKSRRALLSRSSKTFGPGHCSVTTADDGSYQMIYHANLVSGSGWDGRSVRVQPINVTEDSVKLVAGTILKSPLPVLKRKYVVGPVEIDAG